MNITDARNNSPELSTVGLDDETLSAMTSDEIDDYCTVENFTAMFGACDLTVEDLEALRMVAGWQKYWLNYFPKSVAQSEGLG